MGQHRDSIDLIEIEVIDSDPDAFPGGHRATPTTISPQRPRWVVPGAIAVAVLAVAGIVVALQPWQSSPNWRTYPVALRFPPSTTSHQVLADPPGPAFELQSPEAPLATAVTRSTLVGHVFAEPGANFDSGRWAAFSALPSFASPAAEATTDVQVHGIDATLTTNGRYRTATWGPRDRYGWTAESNRMSDAELLDFAGAVGVQNMRPAVRETYDLADLEPIGGIEALRTVQAIARVLDNQRVEYAPAPTVVKYPDDGSQLTLLTIPAPPDSLPMVPFVFGDGIDLAVHGLPGVSLQSRRNGYLVAWMEAGRLFVLTGERSAAEMRDLAETVRPATDEEWTALERLNETQSFGVDSGVDVVTANGVQGTEVGSGVTPSGSEWSMWAFSDSNESVFCLGTQNTGSECVVASGDDQPPLDDWYVYGGHISVRFGSLDTPSIAIVKSQTGTSTHPFVTLPDGRTVVAVFVPEGAEFTVSELVQSSSSETPSP